jgi:hypothetical protein
MANDFLKFFLKIYRTSKSMYFYNKDKYLRSSPTPHSTHILPALIFAAQSPALSNRRKQPGPLSAYGAGKTD